MFYLMNSDEQKQFYLHCHICKVQKSDQSLITKKHVANHIKKHFLAEPELKDKFFIDNENSQGAEHVGKTPGIVTPLESYMGLALHEQMAKDVWAQHNMLSKLGNLLRWSSKTN